MLGSLWTRRVSSSRRESPARERIHTLTRKAVLGLDGCGAPGDPPFNRRTGHGWVRASDGAYADALRKGHNVTLLVTENSGALSPSFCTLLRLYGKVAALPYACDATVYGSARGSPSSFYAHHLASISASIVTADALAVLQHAAHLSHVARRGAPQHGATAADPQPP